MRADKFLAEKFGSRSKAADALKRGLVLFKQRPLTPDEDLKGDEELVFLAPTESYVSGGGYKLARGLDIFQENVQELTAVDLGASTGGFCDCLLQRGAKRVYCVDVGENQLAPSLARDPRVVVMDKTNARRLSRASFPELPDLIVSDLSFISLKHILPVLTELLATGKKAFVLFKPQFECDGVGLGKRGIVPTKLHAALLDAFYDRAVACSLAPCGIVNAPVRAKKNIEYVVFLQKDASPLAKWEFLSRASAIF